MITGRNIAGSNDKNRVEHDFYATSPKSVQALLDVETFEGTIWEPCCGQGHISKELEKQYSDKVLSSDLIDRGYGKTGYDFLQDKVFDCEINNVITNPPYSLAQEFIERSLDVVTDKVAMFLKIQFLEGIGRYDFFQKRPLQYVYVFSDRQPTLNNGDILNPATGKVWATTICHAWFVWNKKYDGEPIIRWLNTRKKK